MPVDHIVQRFDARLLAGESVWEKPLKFSISTAIHFASIALVVYWLRPAWSGSDGMTALAVVSIASALFEVAYIALQGARGAPSHFNTTTPFYAALWSLMALGAVVVLAPMGVVGVLAGLDDQARWSEPVRVGVAVGMTGGAILTLITAFWMGANMSHFVGAQPVADTLVPLVGWSLQGADLRPAHFLATHMAQVVPVAAVLIAAVMTGAFGTVLVAMFATSWAMLTMAVFNNALAGQSLATLLRL